MNVDPLGTTLIVAHPADDSQIPPNLPSLEMIGLFDRLRSGVLKIAQFGTTAQRPTDPILYELYFDTTLGQFIYCSALRGAVAAVWTRLLADALIIGSAEIGSWPSSATAAFFGNSALNQGLTTEYALIQTALGTTIVNAVTGQIISLRIANVEVLQAAVASVLCSVALTIAGTVSGLIFQDRGTNVQAAQVFSPTVARPFVIFVYGLGDHTSFFKTGNVAIGSAVDDTINMLQVAGTAKAKAFHPAALGARAAPLIANYQALVTDTVLWCSTNIGIFTVTLPSAAVAGANISKIMEIINQLTGLNNLTIAVPAGQYLNNTLNGTLVSNAVRAVHCVSDGNDAWWCT